MTKPRGRPIEPGETIGRWTVVRETEARQGMRANGNPFWTRQVLVRCECGTESTRGYNALRAKGGRYGCGCVSHQTTHGMAGTPMYKSWQAMHQRVRDPRGRTSYEGIKVDDRWATFEGFLAHPPAGEHGNGKVLARTGDTGDYSPENTRWATKRENNDEMLERKAHMTSDGQFGRRVAVANGISIGQFRSRVERGWTVDEAARTPPTSQPRCRTSDGQLALDVARRNGIPAGTFSSRIHNGWDVDRAATEPQVPKAKHMTSDGRPGIHVALENGLSRVVFDNRIRQGWTVDDAATTPKWGKRDSPSE